MAASGELLVKHLSASATTRTRLELNAAYRRFVIAPHPLMVDINAAERFSHNCGMRAC